MLASGQEAVDNGAKYGEQHTVHDGNDQLRALRGQGDKHTRGQSNEQRNGYEHGHEMKHLY